MNCVIQISERERARYHAEEMLDAERERSQLINQEWENLKETREVAEKKLQQLQDRLRSVCTKIWYWKPNRFNTPTHWTVSKIFV